MIKKLKSIELCMESDTKSTREGRVRMALQHPYEFISKDIKIELGRFRNGVFESEGFIEADDCKIETCNYKEFDRLYLYKDKKRIFDCPVKNIKLLVNADMEGPWSWYDENEVKQAYIDIDERR